mgnify:CR=1 FL=1
MIHSLSGGFVRELEYADFVKVKILTGESVGMLFWYKTDLIDIKIGDKVEVLLKGQPVEGEIVKIERNQSNQTAPIPIKRAQSIIKKL